MNDRREPDTSGDDQQAERWLAVLRDGSPDEKAAARRWLAAHFEARGMVADALGLLISNAREGYRDAELFQSLARLYRVQGNEYLAASAALEATRLSGRRQQGSPDPDRADAAQTGTTSSGVPWRQQRRSGTEGTGPHRRQTDAPRAARPEPAPSPDAHAAWRRPIRFAGWLVVVVTLLAALGVASSSVVSAMLYIVAAAALGVLLSGSVSARHLLRLPVGPLGDGALVFVCLLLLLVAGAMLPRGSSFVGAFSSQPLSATPTPSLYRTPPPSPSPSPSPVP